MRLLHTDARGIGAGYRLGIEQANAEVCVLSASDLPFGFTDIDAFLALTPRLAIGSKAHPDSVLAGWGVKRRAAGFAFYLLRRTLLGRGTPHDSQGTILIETALAKRLLPDVRSDDYFFSLEIVTLAIAQGVQAIELPVTLEANSGPSSVSLVNDSVQLAKKTWLLRKRLR
ncbi:MAG TPA: hypothetical protein VHU41_13510 [Thermoanaerobaculia bacterium]|jgi:hypothetical protein|nr:hypothetical protein [Thermoanaerobaculia bacterium]